MHPWSSFRLFTDSTFKFHFGLWSVPADKLLNKMQAFVWIHYSLRPLWTRSLFASACERPKSWTWFRKLNFRLHLTEGKILKVICYIYLAKKLRSDCNDRKLDSRGLYFFPCLTAAKSLTNSIRFGNSYSEVRIDFASTNTRSARTFESKCL